MTLDLGFKLPNSGPFASVEHLRVLTLACEQMGYQSVWVTDHMHWTAADAEYHFPSGAVEAWTYPIQPNYFEPVTTLSYLGGVTSRITLGTSIVVLPMRNPVVLAKQIACMDHLLGGRFIVGVGVGGGGPAPRELAAVSLPHLKSKRGKVADEWIEVIRCVWRNSVCSFHGQFIRIESAEVYPKLLQPGGPPMWIAGPGEASMRRAARVGDGWFLNHLLPHQVREHVDALHEQAASHGRDPSAIIVCCELWMSIDADEQRARQNAAATFAGMANREFFEHRPSRTADSGGAASPSDCHLVGRPDQMLERVAAYLEAGMDHLIVRVVAQSIPHMVESLQMFKEEVADRL